jgi:ADP-ribosylglycohydrolase
MKTREEILAATDGRGVTGLVEIPKTHPVCEVGPHPIGSTSDDWALTAAAAQTLIQIGRRERPDRPSAAIFGRERQIALLQTNGAGWGNGTVEGIRHIGRWLDGHTDGREPWSEVPPTDSAAVGKGAGCGPAMQMAPFGLMNADKPSYLRFDDWARFVSRSTHGNTEAAAAAHAMAEAVSIAATQDPNGIWPETRLSSQDILKAIIERLYEAKHETPHERVFGALCLMSKSRFLEKEERLRAEIGNGFLCWESVPFAIGVWLRHRENVRDAILEAASAGGDTDSTAAMAGALAGAEAGIDAIPKEWINAIPNARVAATLADRLWYRVRG